MIPHSDILAEVRRLVDSGVSVSLPVSGRSMLPFIAGGRDSVILRKPRRPRRGDVVLARTSCGRYVLHRVIATRGSRVTLMGDGNIAGTEQCAESDILARATHVVRPSGRLRHLDAPRWRAAAALWQRLRPARRYLLALYRRI